MCGGVWGGGEICWLETSREGDNPDWKQAICMLERLLFGGLVDRARLKEGDMVCH